MIMDVKRRVTRVSVVVWVVVKSFRRGVEGWVGVSCSLYQEWEWECSEDVLLERRRDRLNL